MKGGGQTLYRDRGQSYRTGRTEGQGAEGGVRLTQSDHGTELTMAQAWHRSYGHTWQFIDQVVYTESTVLRVTYLFVSGGILHVQETGKSGNYK